MYKAAIIFFILSINLLVRGASVESRSVYDQLVYIENDVHYKCPYLRKTLVSTHQDFLKDCRYTEHLVKSGDAPCILYYNNFLRLCYHSNDDKLVMQFLTDSVIKASLAETDITNVCGFLSTSSSAFENLTSTIHNIVENMKKKDVCEYQCRNLETREILQSCALSALMNKIMSQTMSDDVKHDKEHISPVTDNPSTGVLSSAKKNDTKPQITYNNNEKSQIVKKHNPVSEKKTESQALINTPKIVVNKKPVATQTARNTSQVITVIDPPAIEHNVKSTEEPVAGINNKLPNPPVEISQKPKKVEGGHQSTAAAQQPETDIKSIPKTNQVDVGVENNDRFQNEAEGETNQNGEMVPPASDEHQEYENIDDPLNNNAVEEPKKVLNAKPKETNEDEIIPVNSNSSQIDEEDSFFFTYFMMVCAVFILGYIGYHNKQKVLALVIEGRRGRRNSRRGGRPNSANYHKLDSNLEEAVTSSVNKNSTNVIY